MVCVLPTLNTFTLFVVKHAVNVTVVHVCPPLHHKYGFLSVIDMHMPHIQVYYWINFMQILCVFLIG